MTSISILDGAHDPAHGIVYRFEFLCVADTALTRYQYEPFAGFANMLATY
jgi:hypothetical protein